MTTRVLLLGAGQIGCAIARLLYTNSYKLTVYDRDSRNFAKLPDDIDKCELPVDGTGNLEEQLQKNDIVINTLPACCVTRIAGAAALTNTHYFDITEDVVTTNTIKQLSKNVKTVMMPQCGLAPGIVSVIAYDLVEHFDSAYDICMRVGALPLYPANALKYNLTWSVDGLVNEYSNDCDIIHNYELQKIPALGGHEQFSIDGSAYEAFYTSGGLGTLGDSLHGTGVVRNLSYKTIRYPGHHHLIKFLVDDLKLGLRWNRDMFKKLLEQGLPETEQDVVIIFVTVDGVHNNRFVQKSFIKRIEYARGLTAIQRATAAGVCTMVDLFREGKLPVKQGFVRQEDVPLELVLTNRFGQIFVEDN
jgi:saccharopine dehydrogenase-like NADP-dependent oxidoreductase